MGKVNLKHSHMVLFYCIFTKTLAIKTIKMYIHVNNNRICSTGKMFIAYHVNL